MSGSNKPKGWISQVFEGIAKVVKQSDSTTKLLAAIFLGGMVSLTVLAFNGVEGNSKIVVVVVGAIVTLFALAMVGSIEKLRIVQGSVVKRSKISSSITKKRSDYDIFISAPMETSLDGQGNVTGRDQILRIRREIENVCDLYNIFYAAAEKNNEKLFDRVALSDNFQTLLKSQRHIFVFPEKKAASTLVEVGMALALGKPSLWLVQEGVKLPFLLREAWEKLDEETELPKITAYRYKSTDDILKIIADEKDDFFA